MKKILVLIGLLTATFSAHAQGDRQLFNHLDASFTVGSTGLGFDLAMPASKYLRVRAGGTFMPRFEYRMRFNVQLVNGSSKVDPEEQEERFNNMRNFFKGFMGTEVADHVDMMGSPRFHNFKLMFDVFPFQKKNWHATVGFYAGRSHVAKAYNTQEGMISLLSVKMYNEMYWRCMNQQPMYQYDNDKTNMHVSADFHPMIYDGFKAYGTLSMLVGYFKEDYYAKQDILWDHDIYELDEEPGSPTQYEMVLVHERGSVRFHEGDLVYSTDEEKNKELGFAPGGAYRILPDLESNMVKVNAFANKIRPYVGIGYSGAVSRDKRSQVSVDMGAMMWGGIPRLITHDGVDLARDLYKLDGQVKRYVNIASRLRCFPVFELRFTQRLF